MIVEPSEIHHETAEFIVVSGVESVLIFSFFRNPIYRETSKSWKDGLQRLSMILLIAPRVAIPSSEP